MAMRDYDPPTLQSDIDVRLAVPGVATKGVCPMRRMGSLFAAALALPAAASLAADQPGTVGRVFVTAARPGMTAQYEAGRKKHMDWHRKQNDTWTWLVWQVETGPNAGSYVSGTFGHQWKDLDDWEKKLGEGDTADGAVNMVPFSQGGSNGIYTFMPDVSRPSATPPPMSQVLHYHLKMGAEQEFKNAMKRIHEAIGKAGLPWNYGWYELVDGGDHPSFVLTIALGGWADLAPSETPFAAMLAKAHGEFEAGEILKAVDRSVKSVRSEVLRFRPDLSYLPAAK
jgi:hypothetical protein